MLIPPWALLLSFWLHMLATTVWLGSLAAAGLFVLPYLRRTQAAKVFAASVTALNRRLDPLGWFCLGLLTFTGLLQMDSNPNYGGLFAVSNSWSVAICAKHIVFFAMIGVSGYLTWSVTPALQRASLASKGSQVQPILTKFQQLIVLNLVLGLVVLAFTALARIS
jgi:uncharacterized membrane protein